jgi:hypothetical protein
VNSQNGGVSSSSQEDPLGPAMNVFTSTLNQTDNDYVIKIAQIQSESFPSSFYPGGGYSTPERDYTYGTKLITWNWYDYGQYTPAQFKTTSNTFVSNLVKTDYDVKGMSNSNGGTIARWNMKYYPLADSFINHNRYLTGSSSSLSLSDNLDWANSYADGRDTNSYLAIYPNSYRVKGDKMGAYVIDYKGVNDDGEMVETSFSNEETKSNATSIQTQTGVSSAITRTGQPSLHFICLAIPPYFYYSYFLTFS